MKQARPVQLRQIAERVGVSPAGVSMALRDNPRISQATRLRVQKAARELGYAPALRKSIANTRRFGFVYIDSFARDFDSLDFGPALQLLMRDSLAMKVRFELLLLDHDVSVAATREKLLEFAAHLEGILLYGTIRAPMLELLRQMDRPAVVIGETDVSRDQARDLKLQRVTDDPMQGGLIATEYLLNRGRRRIAFIGGIRTPGFFYDRWYDGFVTAHAKAGVRVFPELVIWHAIDDPLGKQVAALGSNFKPDAIVWPDATIAEAVRPVLREHGLDLCPQDEVVAMMSHSPALKGQAHYPQVLGDLAALTEEAIRRLQLVCQHGAKRAVSIVVPNIIRNMWSS